MTKDVSVADMMAFRKSSSSSSKSSKSSGKKKHSRSSSGSMQDFAVNLSYGSSKSKDSDN